VDEVLDREAQACHGLDHPRAGDLVAVAEPDAWFTYYYWLTDARAPDFAHGVEIHRKPGYDPAELFFDPHDPLVKVSSSGSQRLTSALSC
jgi:predicted AlkP superfamily pyrophosphatase or phosphodiesterase